MATKKMGSITRYPDVQPAISVQYKYRSSGGHGWPIIDCDQTRFGNGRRLDQYRLNQLMTLRRAVA